MVIIYFIIALLFAAMVHTLIKKKKLGRDIYELYDDGEEPMYYFILAIISLFWPLCFAFLIFRWIFLKITKVFDKIIK